MTLKNIHKIFIPKKIFIFLKTQKNIEIQNFEPKKNAPSLRMYKNIRVPPPPPPPPPWVCMATEMLFLIKLIMILRVLKAENDTSFTQMKILCTKLPNRWYCYTPLCTPKNYYLLSTTFGLIAKFQSFKVSKFIQVTQYMLNM